MAQGPGLGKGLRALYDVAKIPPKTSTEKRWTGVYAMKSQNPTKCTFFPCYSPKCISVTFLVTTSKNVKYNLSSVC